MAFSEWRLTVNAAALITYTRCTNKLTNALPRNAEDWLLKFGVLTMKTLLASTILAFGVLAVSAPAQAKGCVAGAAVGGVAGHVAGGHGLIGAGVGCLVGRHRANKADKAAAAQQAAQQRTAPAK